MNPISSIRPVATGAPNTIEKPASGDTFRNFLDSAVKQVETAMNVAEQSVNAFLTGENEELHSVALATQRAELQLELSLQVRNKVVQAYQEIMRMQV